MLTFRDMRLTVYKHEKGEEMVVLYARDVTVGDKEAYSSVAGLSSLSFYFEGRDFFALLDGRSSSANDCGHNLRALGELWTFYNLDFPSGKRGVMSVPWVNLDMPIYVRRVLKRAVKRRLRACVPGGERLEIVIPWELRERWMRQYGQGTGRVTWDVSSPEFLDECKAKGGETFANCLDNLRRIAANCTWRHTDAATVQFSKDRDDWYFRILRPDGRCTLNGGVINHGRTHDNWSTHT